MKRIMIIIAAVALSLGISAQEAGYNNYVGLNIGGGLNTMVFNPNSGSSSLGLGFNAGLHYAHFLGKSFGIGLGINYTYANAYSTYNFTDVRYGLTHADNPNVHYNLTTQFNDWKEREIVGLLGVPIEFLYRKSLTDKICLLGGFGLQLDIPIHGTYSPDGGSYTTTGVFPALGSYIISDMPEHGFGTYDGTYDAKVENLTADVSLMIDMGLRYALKNHWGLYVGLYAGYGLTNMIEEQKSNPLLIINPVDPSVFDYYGTFGSDEIDEMHLLRAGMKVEIDFGWNGRDRKAEREAL